jgi:hypothetical protein
LTNNSFRHKEGVEWSEAFRVLPSGLTSLDLSENGLGTITVEQLVLIFSALPRSVTRLDVSGNYLDSHSYDNFRLFVESMPTAVRAKIGGKIDYSQAIIPLSRLARNPTLASGAVCGNVLGNEDIQRKVLSFLDPIKAKVKADLDKNLSLMKTPSQAEHICKRKRSVT